MSSDEIDDSLGDRIVEKTVDGKVAPLGVLFGRRVDDPVGASAVGVGTVGSERRDFDLALGLGQSTVDEHNAKGFADGACVIGTEDFTDLLGGRVGGDIEVFGSQAQQSVSHAPSGIVSHVASVDQTPNDFVGKLPMEGTCME